MKKWLILLSILLIGAFLRFYDISQDPPGLYMDEVSIGNNAYSILSKGQDQYGKPYPLFFEAFGEYKKPVYIYLTSLSMAVFGKTDFAVRFPSALFGTLTLVPFFFLLSKLFSFVTKKDKENLTLTSVGTLILATSSWHLHFSRGGFEATVALFFFVSALSLYFKFLSKKTIQNLIFAYIFLGLTFYTYDGYRLIVPIFTLLAFFLGLKGSKNKKQLIFITLMFFLSIFPLIYFSFSKNGLARFSQTSAFYSHWSQNLFIQFAANLVIYIKNLLSFFSLTYFFHLGDQINRHQVQGFGLLYFWQFPFLILGVFYLIKKKTKALSLTILLLILAAPITAALTIPSPHTLRNLLSVIPLTVLTVLGLFQVSLMFYKNKKLKTIIFLFTAIIALVQFVYYLDYYYVHYPKEALMDWGGSCKEVAIYLNKEKNNFKTILIDRNLLCIQDYFAFYSPKIKTIYTDADHLPTTFDNTIWVTPKINRTNGNLINTFYSQNQNHDVFAQIWKL